MMTNPFTVGVGQKIENIRNFTKHFPKCEIVRLEQNYRSTATILNAANALIAHNRGALGQKFMDSR